MSNELHTMPLHIERLLSSGRVKMLELDEFGAYVKLLSLAWLDGARLNSCVTAKSNWLSKLLSIDVRLENRIRKNVVDVFFVDDGNGNLVNPSQVSIYIRACEKSKKASAKASAAIKARWEKEQYSKNTQSNTPSNSSSNTQSNTQVEHPNPNPNPKNSPVVPLLPETPESCTYPTPAKVVEYALSPNCGYRGFDREAAEFFIDHYRASGRWPADWQAQLRNWKRKDGGKWIPKGPAPEPRAFTPAITPEKKVAQDKRRRESAESLKQAEIDTEKARQAINGHEPEFRAWLAEIGDEMTMELWDGDKQRTGGDGITVGGRVVVRILEWASRRRDWKKQ